jgi:hypothetical protein
MPHTLFVRCTFIRTRSYISRPWYAVEQAPNSYQPRNALFCVRAEYRRSPNDPSRILVHNQARQNSVTGSQTGGGGVLLNAIIKDESRGKLAVGPAFLPTSAYGAMRYCVVNLLASF